MGFLNNVTNNIILDAVLTDEGRKRLARNDRSFVITMFALGDDEVDYTIIKKYGRAVGKEKIEKNTPILEALTQGTAALKSPLVSSTVPTLTRMPTIHFKRSDAPAVAASEISGAAGMTTVQMKRFGRDSATKIAFQTANGIEGTTPPAIPYDLQDASVIITLDTRLLRLQGVTASTVDSSGVGKYLLPCSPMGGGTGLAQAVMVVQAVSVSDEIFNSYLVSGATTVTRYMTVTGRFSGAHTSIAITIENSG